MHLHVPHVTPCAFCDLFPYLASSTLSLQLVPLPSVHDKFLFQVLAVHLKINTLYCHSKTWYMCVNEALTPLLLG